MVKNDLKPTVLFITPPFTQLNTPYPATPFLKGFLNTRNIFSHQTDLGIEVINAIFSSCGIKALFGEVEKYFRPLSSNARRMVQLSEDYTLAIDPVVEFLRGSKPELAHLVCGRKWLPEASRFGQTTDLDHDFGRLGIHDRAKYLATLFLEDISDLIVEAVDPHFGFSRYAERLGRSASTFDELEDELSRDQPLRFLDRIMTGLLQKKISDYAPSLVALTVPFPGNLYSAFKCGQWLKKHHPDITVVMGGGFVNTELRSLTDPRVFKYTDFITLDDGEIPLLNLIEHLDGKRDIMLLKRTFTLMEGSVAFINGSDDSDVKRQDTGIPDYSDLPLEKYLSVMELANPMHRLWSDGFWNKLMLAHGCYWGKCTFCDVTLDYIKRYEPNSASILCDRMESLISQTGRNGFHFTDEAAPPMLLRDLAIEIIRRKLTVLWWTNIRFEKKFTNDLCMLLKTSGCIAVSGGLEVASERILKMINKGVTVSQVAGVAGNFTRAGIMVHAYLMYGFPTQTAQETIDSLEVVRQLFMNGVIQSGFWHQFAMTAHSPVGINPEKFGVEKASGEPGSFANNDLIAIDRTGCNHENFSAGLKKSLYNFMHSVCFDFPLQEWFDFQVPETTMSPRLIRNILSQENDEMPAPHSRIVWLGGIPAINFFIRQKKGKSSQAARLTIQTRQKEVILRVNDSTGKWLMATLQELSPDNGNLTTFHELEKRYYDSGLGNFKAFWNGQDAKTLRENGLLAV
ncbi:MAG: radical SAM protein [Bacteroidetes bacterium]|nr:radical SAM protein [Bacteroidota bacterium]